MKAPIARFSLGQIVHHRLFGYRGVIFDADDSFQGTDEWYENVALTRPPRDRPWYRVLVHGSNQSTYVAERNLEPEADVSPIENPYTSQFFSEQTNGVYRLRRKSN